MSEEQPGGKQEQQERTWTEEFEVAGNQLVERVRELIEEGNVRHIIIRKPDDEVLLDIPLTTGMAVSGAVAFFAPPLAALGAVAALVARVKLEVVRVTDDDA
jgi:hypothetical protein